MARWPARWLSRACKSLSICLWAIASCTISLHPILVEKTKLSLKKNSEICVLDIFFRNEILYYGFFYPELIFYFCFRIFISETQLFLFWIFFFGMYYFSILDFFVRNRILILVSRFLFPKLNNYFWIYFSGIYYFQFWIFISGIKGIFGN